MSYIADGEFPDDELTNITYMIESNDNYDDLLHDLSREDDGEGTDVKIGDRRVKLAEVVNAITTARDDGENYEGAIKPFLADA
jgi:hypothetical protein